MSTHVQSSSIDKGNNSKVIQTWLDTFTSREISLTPACETSTYDYGDLEIDFDHLNELRGELSAPFRRSR